MSDAPDTLPANFFDQQPSQSQPAQPTKTTAAAPNNAASTATAQPLHAPATLPANYFDKPAAEAVQTLQPQPPNNVYQAAPNERTPEGHAAAVQQREAQHPILTAVGQGAADVLSDAWDTVKGTPKALLHSLPPVAFYDSIQRTLPVIDAYEKARASGKSVTDALSTANETAKNHDAAHQVLEQRISDFKKSPGRASVRAMGDAALILSTIYDGGKLNPASLEVPRVPYGKFPAYLNGRIVGFADDVNGTNYRHFTPVVQEGRVVGHTVNGETFSQVKQPSRLQQIVKGADVAEPQAQDAMRSAVQAGTNVPNVQPKSLRTIVERPIDVLEQSAKAKYRQIDQAAGTDFKALNEKLDNTEWQIRQLTDTEEDALKEAALEKSRQGIIDKIEQAKADAIKNGVDPKVLDEADDHFSQARALRDVETKVFKNPNIVKGNAKYTGGEIVDVNQAVKALQRLQDSNKYGTPRLEQAIGKEAADGLLKEMYEAQRQGTSAMSTQRWAKILGKWGLGAVGIGAAKHLIQ